MNFVVYGYNFKMRDKVFYIICFGFVFGVFLRSFVAVDLYFTILLSIISFSLVLFFTLISKDKWGITISIFVFVFCFGILRFHAVDVGAPSIFEKEVGKKRK